jgi:two-component SAPR family response regulator
MTVRCLVVYVAPVAIRVIEKHISQIDSLKVVASCYRPLKAFETVKTQVNDVMSLDIKIRHFTGIDSLKTFKTHLK